MATVTINLPHHRYDVIIEPGALDRLGALARDLAPHDRCALFVDPGVMNLYGEQVRHALHDSAYKIATHVLTGGEAAKNLDTIREGYDVLLDARLERRSPVIALGGGVTGDATGFIAATYLRGVPFIQCPTTLLAMVDASVGGKTGVNVPQGKNLVGAFHQPVVVIVDPLTLQTLPPRELRCGLAECVKHAVIRDADLFEWTADNLPAIQAMQPDALVELLTRNIQIKADVVMKDEKESSVRAHLNLGHTFAHAIEATCGYGEILHGEAVSLGMLAATSLSVTRGLCDANVRTQLDSLLTRIGLPTTAALPDEATLLAAMRHDKKVADSRLRLVLPTAVGQVTIIDDADDAQLTAAWQTVRA
ncbi:MAG: 3-dehydroquinate synthase [Planctomycetaceae bacterium]|nr:3-dehydroquinate synthase [Planctomycetaceae bacterium]